MLDVAFAGITIITHAIFMKIINIDEYYEKIYLKILKNMLAYTAR